MLAVIIINHVMIISATEVTLSMVEGFLTEALMIKGYSHLNVLETLAISFPPDDLPRVALPLMTNGDLKSLLRQEKLVSQLVHTSYLLSV